jgi:hypothetical protein
MNPVPVRVHFELDPGADPGPAVAAVKAVLAGKLPAEKAQILDVEAPEYRTGIELAVGIVLHLLLAYELFRHRNEVRELLAEMRQVADEIRQSGIPIKELKVEIGTSLIPVTDITEEDLDKLRPA